MKNRKGIIVQVRAFSELINEMSWICFPHFVETKKTKCQKRWLYAWIASLIYFVV